MKFYPYLLILILSLSYRFSFSQVNIRGIVFLDKNRNGIMDNGETGINKIPVSNGKDIVFTNAKGQYKIQCKLPVSIFPVLPSEFEFPKVLGNIPNANFSFLETSSDSVVENVNFALYHSKVKDSFTLAVVGDIQVNDADEIMYASKSIASELSGSSNIDMNIILGDHVNDKPEFLPVMQQIYNSFSASTWTVYGNHDRIVNDSTTSDLGYRKFFKSTVYSFNQNNVHFIVLNNMLPKGKYGYESRFSDDELTFVRNDLMLIPNDKLVIIALHGPVANTKNKEELLTILNDRTNVLFVSGHTHTVNRYFYKNSVGVIPELGAGASCGNWWTGERNESGIPSSLMQCGSYPNYFLVNISKNRYTFKYKAIGLDASKQMDIWVTDSMTLNGEVKILANIFGGSDSTKVSFDIDDQKYGFMEKTPGISPNVVSLLKLYEQKIYPTAGNKRNPLRKKTSPHIWVVKVIGLEKGVHKIKIHASDNYGFDVNETKLFYVQ